MKYCVHCQRNVKPEKKFSWVAFLLLLGVFYLPYHLIFKKKQCPICAGAEFEKVSTA